MKRFNYIMLLLTLLCTLPFLAQGQDVKSKKVQIHAEGACGMCIDRIQNYAIITDGVLTAQYDLEKQILTVEVDKNIFDKNQLHQNIANAGHNTNKVKAPAEAYANLPACCQYDGIPEIDNVDKEDEHAGHDHAEGEGHDEHEGHDHAEGEGHDEHEGHDHAEGEGHDEHAGHDHAEGEGHDDTSEIKQPFKNVAAPAANVTGMIYERDRVGNRVPLIGATVKWLDSGLGTVTDIDGQFSLERVNDVYDLEVSYVGYQNDTISMKNESMVSIVLTDALTLNTVNVVHRKKTTEISYLNPIKVQNIGEKEFLKAACCNIAESFETNPSVDVSFTDAVTGTRKIQLLGLEGPNILVTRENMPYIRGLAALYGFEFTPGTWLEGIQLNMGTGSVANGFESLAGQINVELKKPCGNMEKLYLNFYGSEGGRIEANANIRHDINDKWSAATLLHVKRNFVENDRNNDNFLDSPLKSNFIALNRWKFIGDDGFRFQAGIKGTLFNSTSGQVGYDRNSESTQNDLWGASVDIKRAEGWVKLGKVFLDNPLASMGLQLSGSYHEQDAQFGIPSREGSNLFKNYDGTQESFYANYLYQNVLGSTKHKYRVGYSFQYDNFDELVGLTEFKRREISTGIFAEYTYQPSEVFTAVLGLRQDLHNSYGVFFTPRANLRYAPNDDTVFRLAAGRSLRTASVFAENIGIFASNRQIRWSPGAPADFPYSLKPEVGWNFGANVSKAIRVGAKEVVFGADYYYTFFQDQVIVDYDHDVRSISIYNLEGPSYSHSIQAQVDVELFPRFDVRLAYRYNDVKTKYLDGLLRKPLISSQRAFVNVGYEIEHKWAFDATVNWQGRKRIPSTAGNPEEFQLDEYSPDFVVVNAQVTKKWKSVEWYVGVENLFNFMQDAPIISADNPSSEFFDSSLVWGPIFGRNIFTGVRYKIQ